MRGSLGPLTNEFGIGLLPKNFFPHFQISRNARIAIGFPLQAAHEKQEAWSPSEGRPGGFGRWVGSAKCLVKPMQPAGLHKMFLLTSGDARERIKVRRQPAAILCQQMLHKWAGRFRACPYQILPGRFGSGAAGHNHVPGPDANVTAIKIKHSAIGNELLDADGLPQHSTGFRIEP